MSLLRKIRMPPQEPTQAMLKRAINKYGIRRSTGARFMGIGERQFASYCLPPESKGSQKIPLIRWQAFLLRLKEMHHPQEEVEL